MEQFKWSQEDARGMCVECGTDEAGGAARCPCPTKEGHDRTDSWAHAFPEGYLKTLKGVHPRIG